MGRPSSVFAIAMKEIENKCFQTISRLSLIKAGKNGIDLKLNVAYCYVEFEPRKKRVTSI